MVAKYVERLTGRVRRRRRVRPGRAHREQGPCRRATTRRSSRRWNVSSEVAAPEAGCARRTAWRSAGVPAADAGMDAGFGTIERALADLAAGRPVVVVDDADRENEGDLIFAAEKATPELVSFMVRYTSGYICVALTEADCDRLDLPPMHHTNLDSFRTAFTVTVDAKAGITTGISAADRARTIALLADPDRGRRRPGAAGARAAAAGPRGRRAAPAGTHRGRRRPRPAGRARPGRARCARSSPRRTRATWPAATSCGCSPRTTTSTLISIAQLIAYRRRTREARGARRAGPDPDPARRVRRLRLRLAARRHRAHRAGPRRRRHA